MERSTWLPWLPRHLLIFAIVIFPSIVFSQTPQVVIDFEQFAGSSVFSGIQPPLTAGGATISGGQILRNTTFLPADQTTVYGTAIFSPDLGLFCLGCLPTITIDFVQKVSNF